VKKTIHLAIAIFSGIFIPVALNTYPVQALTFRDTTKGTLTLQATGFSGSDPEIPITGQGTFEYSSEPIEGSFVYLTSFRNDPEFRFVKSLDDLPDYPGLSISARLDIDRSQNLRFVKNADMSLSLGSKFSYRLPDLNSGNLLLFSTLLFEPPNSSSFPPGSGGVFSVSGEDPRRVPPLRLLLEERWFFGSPFGASAYQLNLSNNGSLFGIVSENLPNVVDFSGTWTAEAADSSQPPTTSVPEAQPLTMVGASAVLGLAALGKR